MQYIVGNWKMNGTYSEAQALVSGLLAFVHHASPPLPQIIICPPSPYLVPLKTSLSGSLLALGAQDCSPEKNGSFTGDISAAQLADVGCAYVILGHSERRRYHKESSSLIRKKVEAALQGGLIPIVCIGEEADDYHQGKVFSVLSHQITSDLPLDLLTSQNILIAYEPVWAIGTGLTPKPEEIETVGTFIKHQLSMQIPGGEKIPVLYGGSANAVNAPLFLALPSLNGLLVGGASLKVEDFTRMIQAAGERL